MARVLRTDATTEDTKSAATDPQPPTRVLVQTLPRLLPEGKYSFERKDAMLDQICLFYWNRTSKYPRFRLYMHKVEFAYPNRKCFFLVDHGECADGDHVPVVSYEWTGDAFVSRPQLAAHPKVQKVLSSKIPFNPQPRGSEPERLPVRKAVRRMLRNLDRIPLEDLEYMRAHEEDQEWLRTHVRPRLWENFVYQRDHCFAYNEGDEFDAFEVDGVVIEKEDMTPDLKHGSSTSTPKIVAVTS
ncbi:hypothetical protein BDZ85DRAFT_252167 [Elsinoe ampelina]|uniref:Uncharacterized protein n=1 Tax=Elsinoe ampelina TaxID=302913 RepID=A0A6A6G3B3_9PEZI|nr:hypothetical protein BDZ85DRAFT_252167 [Elsinoe ampelina]